MKISNYAHYSKAIVGVISTIATVLQTVWPASHWSAAVTSGIMTALVFLVPNAPKGTGIAVPAAPAAKTAASD